MLTIPLARLEREGRLEIQAQIPPDDPSWEGTELRFSAPLSVSGHVQWIASGEVLVHLRLQGTLDQECRRCLEAVRVPVDEEVEILYAPVDEAEEMDAERVRPLPTGDVGLDIREAIREEMILTQSPLVLCKTDCRGLCPQCGANWNYDRCTCSQEASDPRWDALRALRKE